MVKKTHEVEKPFRAGIFDSAEAAEAVVRRLQELGFTDEHLAVLCSDKSVQQHFPGLRPGHVNPNEAANSAVVGSITGAVLGGLIGVVMMTGAGLPIIILGPGMLGGALAGGLVGELATRGVETEVANFYDQSVSAGQLLVAVEYHGEEADEKLAEAEKVFRDAGAMPLALDEG